MFIQFSREQKDIMIEAIQRFFYEERNEEIGLIAAESIFDFFKENMGPHFYNEAIKDARFLIEQKMISMEDDLYALEKKTK